MKKQKSMYGLEQRIYERESEGLLAVIENEMKLDALTDSVFLFCKKSHKLLKLIFRDKTGFWLAQKRLEKNTWTWPDNSEKSNRQSKPKFAQRKSVQLQDAFF